MSTSKTLDEINVESESSGITNISTIPESPTAEPDIQIEEQLPILELPLPSAQQPGPSAVSTHGFAPKDSGAPIFNYPTYTTQPIPPSNPHEIALVIDPKYAPGRTILEQSLEDEVKAKSVPMIAQAAERALKIRANAAALKETEKEEERKMSKKLKKMPSKTEELPREYNTGGEVEKVISDIGIKKILNPIDKTLFMGFLAGLFVSFAGMFQVSVTGGTPPELRAAYPFIPKLLTAITFPIGLVFIIMFGGELFTGNTMILSIAWLNKRVTLKELLLNWLLVFISNLASIALIVYLLCYLTGIFATEPFHGYITALAARKASLPFWQMILMGIPANALVCLAFFLGLAARDMTGKILGLYLPIACFAATGWEHCVANMFFILTGWMYGANVSVAGFCMNLFFVGVGNTIGGAILIGGSEYYLYHWHSDNEPTRHSGKSIGRNRRLSVSNGFVASPSDGMSVRRTSKSFISDRASKKKSKKWWLVGKKVKEDEELSMN